MYTCGVIWYHYIHDLWGHDTSERLLQVVPEFASHPPRVPIEPITRARVKWLKEALAGLVKEVRVDQAPIQHRGTTFGMGKSQKTPQYHTSTRGGWLACILSQEMVAKIYIWIPANGTHEFAEYLRS